MGESQAHRLVALARDSFGSTWQVAANHLCNLGFIGLELRSWLERQQPASPSRTWVTRLPAVGGPSLEMGRLTQRSHEAGHLTDSEARAILGLDLLDPLPWEQG
jgi:hypothetical protein